MITRVNLRLRNELSEYNVRFCCEDCAHFEGQSSECSLGYSCEPHRKRQVEPGDAIVFCKTFELA